MTTTPSLKRALSFPQLVLYGLGTTIGAGIYALVGELAAVAGYGSLAAFALAAIMASFTALSFAELSARYPRAAGAAVFVGEGLNSQTLSTLVGLLVVAAGLVSSAALVNALMGYVTLYVALPEAVGIVLVTLLLGAIAIWGIGESVTIAGLITLIEVGGLLLVIWVSKGAFDAPASTWQALADGFLPSHWGVVFSGALLAFYAFIGFEDMVVVAEEVRGTARTLPLAVVTTLVVTTVLYLLVTAEALLSFAAERLAASATPLVDLYRFHTGGATGLIEAIAALAIVNGALIQIIMAARVLYGLAHRGQAPRLLARIHPRTQTPLLATVVGTLLVMVMAVIGHLGVLAELTSVIMLLVFTLANLALCRIKWRGVDAGAVVFSVPGWVPLAGFLVSGLFVLRFLLSLLPAS